MWRPPTSEQFSQKQAYDSLEEADDLYPQIEEEFQAALDTSLNPRGPEIWLVILACHQERPS